MANVVSQSNQLLAIALSLTSFDILLIVLILLGIVSADWLLGVSFRRSRRWLATRATDQQRHWLDLAWSFLYVGVRLLLWAGVLAWGIIVVPGLDPLEHIMLEAALELAKIGIKLRDVSLLTLDRKPVTLGNLLLFVAVALGMLLLSRWLSGWIKRRILSRLRLDRGTQEAIASVIGYLLAALSFIIVLQTVGIDLSSLAVIAGVLGIGFGFGFQLLASNFISGLAILLEQPIKVGDFIEVDGLLGTVEKVAIRSTVIRTNDGLFVIVPNNRFIEKNVVNWSYRNPNSRIHIPVTVAYGSDTVLVTEALLAAARQDARVLVYPSPSVWFKRFAESAYEFELLVWINRPQDFDPIKSALNFLIEHELRQRGIEMPFPQRELHIRNPTALRQLLQPDQPSQTSELADSSHFPRQRSPIDARQQTLSSMLRQVIYFEQCSDSELRMLIERGYQKFFLARQVIFREKEAGNTFYIILSGAVEVFSEQLEQANTTRNNPTGVIAILSTGDFFGEISLLTGLPRSATIRAKEDTTLFVVDHNALQVLLQEHRGLAETIATALVQRQQVLQDLGLLEQAHLDTNQETALDWIRDRINTLFGL
ncbi:MAG: mechanosensitive ion channel [Aphanocapsa sp. GSE-SYN-MK-11-07L]|jgi:small-conductance mechanosensitive channel/CRP-like cAMP-binding protein|nr:mechanosensitive ion channel [Aphanocapsa sp. GSE-SYN-MK-11-07L]